MSESLSLLIAEDELPTRRGLLHALQTGLQGKLYIHAAENGIEALEYAKAHHVDLLITDIRMPGLSGIELIEQLNKENQDLASILLTGYAEFEYARKALVLGAVNYLLKPVEQRNLIEAVQRAMGVVQERKQLRKASQGLETAPKEAKEEYEAFLPKIRNESIRKALKYIMAEFHRESLSMKDLAEHIHLNPSYASMLFKEETKESFSDFVTRVRLTRAKELLLQTDRKIYEIAESIGFASSKYFVRVFREAEGMTPKQYRKVNVR